MKITVVSFAKIPRPFRSKLLIASPSGEGGAGEMTSRPGGAAAVERAA